MKTIKIFIILSLFLGGWNLSLAQTYEYDDIYAPKNNKKPKIEQKTEKKQEQSITNSNVNNNIIKSEKPDYTKEDYYDYAYASRFRRFHNPCE